MEIKYDEKQNRLVFLMSDKDMGDARKIEETMKSEGWKILEKYYILI